MFSGSRKLSFRIVLTSLSHKFSGQLIADVVSNSDHITQTHHPECQTPHYNKHIHQISPRCLTHYTIGHRGQINTHYHQTTYPSSPHSTYNMTTDYNKTDGHSPTTKKLTGHNSRKTQSLLFRSDHHTHQYTQCQHNFHKHHTDGRQAQHTKGQDA